MNSILKAIGNSVVLKVIVSQALGAAAATADAAIQGGPTGGAATWFAAHPQAAVLYVAAAQWAHVFLSKYSTPAPTAPAPAPPAH